MVRIATLLLTFFAINIVAQNQHPNNQDGAYEDMLTPAYYSSNGDSAFIKELNKFVNFARKLPFSHPLEDSLGNMPSITEGRGFGAGIGPGGSGSHHPAIDLYVGNRQTKVTMYAAHNGVIETNRTVDRYRHYISISQNISDEEGNILGKIMTLYGHVDLDMDEADGLDINGKTVKKGDIISKNLYAGTMGGPHLHLEIRYYRSSDTGKEDFYGGRVGDKTEPSAGSWTYGYWNPDAGYGFADPNNHLYNDPNKLFAPEIHEYSIYPNPTNNLIYLKNTGNTNIKEISIHKLNGEVLNKYKPGKKVIVPINFSTHPSGVYLLRWRTEKGVFYSELIVKH